MSLRLHLNENSGECSPAVLEALRRIEPQDVSIYPDYKRITATCEHWFGVAPGWVQLTNGLDEGLYIAAQCARVKTDPPGSVLPSALVVDPAFEEYPVCAAAAGLDLQRVFWDPRGTFPTDALLQAIRPETRLVYLTDPNNPTGLPIPEGVVERLAASAPHTIILLDEAYAEFSGRH